MYALEQDLWLSYRKRESLDKDMGRARCIRYAEKYTRFLLRSVWGWVEEGSQLQIYFSLGKGEIFGCILESENGTVRFSKCNSYNHTNLLNIPKSIFLLVIRRCARKQYRLHVFFYSSCWNAANIFSIELQQQRNKKPLKYCEHKRFFCGLCFLSNHTAVQAKTERKKKEESLCSFQFFQGQ